MMRSDVMKLLGLLPLAGLLVGCAGGSDRYPSLAIRPFENGAVVAAPEPPAPPVRPETASARLAALRAAADAADRAFTEREANAARLAGAAAGLPIESKERAAAIVALSDLDTKRSATAGTLAALDSLAAQAATSLSADPGVAALQGEVAALLARQDASLARLWEVLGT